MCIVPIFQGGSCPFLMLNKEISVTYSFGTILASFWIEFMNSGKRTRRSNRMVVYPTVI